MKDWLEKMNDALNYIEDNLDGNIDMGQVARQACCSSFNFQRMFSFITDIPIGEYIRRRRLSMAAMELLESKGKIIDVAMRYGYDSPGSFTRAFYAVHGVNPSDVRKPGVKIKAYPPISFQISIKGVESMNYRIEEFGEIRLVGYKERMDMKNGENFKRIPKFWNEICESGKCEAMIRYNDNKNLCCMGVCAHGDEEGFDYYIATGSSKEVPEDMCELIVTASTYVIFECIGKLPEGQQNVWKRIFTEWFPKSNYKIADGPQMEWYSEGDMASEDYKSEIWIPVDKK
ncbi:AraC family transcriptional regulator [Hathewaya proteolytica DSM 3090]|uniref:AraC family transcriptional regulator n=1 Tax=Hathewaya proteolytica DSM 3090 TaxID=1121331 RepID=A0A1M6M0I2_9CLOT|nr:AraC family transcriptional regulator [Hathewaya proteolytica]SHJ76916.1 AraC family transcriptional regulator [Hathewaya proteolytica DSM 3090]